MLCHLIILFVTQFRSEAHGRDPMSTILPRMLAMHMVMSNYRLLLSSAYRRLLVNTKYYEIKQYHRKRDYYFELEVSTQYF